MCGFLPASNRLTSLKSVLLNLPVSGTNEVHSLEVLPTGSCKMRRVFDLSPLGKRLKIIEEYLV